MHCHDLPLKLAAGDFSLQLGDQLFKIGPRTIGDEFDRLPESSCGIEDVPYSLAVPIAVWTAFGDMALRVVRNPDSLLQAVLEVAFQFLPAIRMPGASAPMKL